MDPLYHSTQPSPIPTTSGIYRITCMITGKIYIGSAFNLRNRRDVHFRTLHRNIHHNPTLQRAFNKYGPDAFTFDILELVLVRELLTAREQYWLDKLKPWDKKGFNLSHIAGSTLGMFHSPAALAKMSAAKLDKIVSPETRTKLSIAGLGNTNHRGKKASLETRAKQSIAHMGNPSNLGRKLSPEHCAKISASQPQASLSRMKTLIVTDPDGVEHTIHGINRFCKEHNLTPFHITQVAKGERNHYKGWKARFPDLDVS